MIHLWQHLTKNIDILLRRLPPNNPINTNVNDEATKGKLQLEGDEIGENVNKYINKNVKQVVKHKKLQLLQPVAVIAMELCPVTVSAAGNMM